MKFRLPKTILALLGVGLACNVHAATLTKANNTTALNDAGSWSENAVPTSDDTLLWNSTVAGANSSALGASLSVLGLQVTNPGGAVTIANTAGATLTIGAGGIDMSTATQNLTLASSTVVGASQTWTVGSGRTLIVGQSSTLAINNDVTLNGSGITFIGNSGVTTLTGSANINIDNGRLAWGTQAGSSIAGYTGSFVLGANGKLSINTTNTLPQLIINGGTIGSFNGTGRTMSSALTVGGDFTVGGSEASGTVGNISSGTITFSGATDLSGGTRTINTVVATTFSGVVSNGGLIKNGAGTLNLGAINTYTGGTTVNEGILSLNTGGGSGAIRGTVTVNSGATLRLNAGDATGFNTDATRLSVINLVGGTLNINSTSNQTLGSAVVNMTGGSITGIAGTNLDFFAGSSALNTLASATTSTISGTKITLRQTGGVTFTVADGAADTDLEISSVVTNANYGSNPLIKAGEGTMLLSGNNNYSGATTVNAGTLKAGSSSAFGTGAVTVNAGTLDLGVNSNTVGAVTLNSGSITGTTGVLTATSYSANAGSISAILAGTGAFTKTGTGTLILSGANTYTGVTTIKGNNGTSGQVNVSSIGNGGVAGNLGQATAAATNLVFGESGLTTGKLVYTGAGESTDRLFTVNGNVIIENIGSGALNFTGTGDLGKTSGISQTFTVGGSGDGSIAANIIKGAVAGSDVSVTKTGTGTWTLSGTNTYTAGTTVTAGTLKAGSASAFGAASSAVTVNGGTLDLNGQAIGNNVTLSGAGTIINSAATGIGLANLALGTAGSVNTNGQTLTVSGALTGSGTITGNLVVNGDLGIGNSPGLVTVTGNTTLTSATESLFEIGGIGERGTAYDALTVTGTLTLDGTINVVTWNNFDTTTLIAGASFDLLDWGTLDASGFNVATDLNLSSLTLANGLAWDTSNFTTNGTISVTEQAIPEPSSLGLLGVGMAGMLLRRRRKQA